MPEQPAINDKSVSQLFSQAGIKRDGTQLDGNYFSDGQWCRFRLGRPKKIGGYREIVNGLNGPIRGLSVVANNPLQIVNSFSGYGVQCALIDNDGGGGSVYDRTPAGFTVADKYLWQYDSIFDTNGGAATIVAHPGQNLTDIAQTTTNPVYYGVANATAILTSTGQSVDGGCCAIQPFLFMYGSNGLIKNSATNNVLDYATSPANTANVCGTKIVQGLQIRGGSASPAGLFWSLDSVIRVTFVGGTTKWNYDTLTSKSSILTPASVVDYDGQMFWPGVDRFLTYNGVVKELPNALNQDWFFSNLNWSQRMKVWGTKIPQWGEIWWMFPKGTSTECDWAIIYNVRENTWYDTPFPQTPGSSGRSQGYYPRVVTFPVWADSLSNIDVNNTSTMDKTRVSYRLYRQEFGTDAVVGENQLAIDSYFESMNFGISLGGSNAQGVDNRNQNTRITKVEPNFVQTGNMTMVVTGQKYPQSPDVDSGEFTFTPTTEKIEPREQRRLMRVRFRSNVQGGDYHMGRTQIHIEPGDDRP